MEYSKLLEIAKSRKTGNASYINPSNRTYLDAIAANDTAEKVKLAKSIDINSMIKSAAKSMLPMNLKNQQERLNQKYRNTDLAAAKSDIEILEKVVSDYENWVIPIASGKGVAYQKSKAARDNAKTERQNYLSESLKNLGYASLDELKSDLKYKRNVYEKAFGIQEYDKQVAEAKKQAEEEAAFAASPEAKLGWEKYVAGESEPKSGKAAAIGAGVASQLIPGVNWFAPYLAQATYYANDEHYKHPTIDWNEHQRLVFGYYYNQSPEKAFEYAENLNNLIAKTKNDETLKGIAEDSTSSFGGAVGNYIGSLHTKPLAMAEYLDKLIEYAARGTITEKEGITPFGYAQAVQGAQASALNEKVGTLNEDIPVIGGKGLGDAYSLGTSTLESTLSGLGLGSWGTLINYFGQAATAGVNDAIERGATAGQALVYGTLVGLAEGIAEKIGIDNLFKTGSSKTVKQFISNVLKQGAAEGLEEGLTSVMSDFADRLVMMDKSAFNTAVEEYKNKGYGDAEARELAWKDMAEQVAFDSLGGFLSGAGRGLGVTTVQTVNEVRNEKVLNELKKAVEESLKKPTTESEINDAIGAAKSEMQTTARGVASQREDLFGLSAANPKGDVMGDAIAKSSGIPNRTADQKTLRRLGKAFGVNIDFADLDYTVTNENGEQKLVSPEGEYNRDTNTITLNSNAKDYHRPVEFVVKHELSHRTELAGYDYEKFMGDVTTSDAFNKYVQQRVDPDTGKNFANMDEWQQSIIDRYNRAGRPLGNETESAEIAARKEMVADFVADELFGGRNFETLLNAVAPQYRNGFVKLISEIFANLKEFFRNDSRLTEIERLEKEFIRAAKKAAKSSESGQQKTTTDEGSGSVNENFDESKNEVADTNKSTQKVGVDYDDDTKSVSPSQMSLPTWEESEYVKNRNEAAASISQALGVSKDKALKYIDDINSIAATISNDLNRLGYESSGRSSFVSNAEYGGSIDFSTLCQKRKWLTGTFSAIQKALKNTALTATEILEIRNMLKDKGIEVSCGLCYVEGSRASMGIFADKFIERYKAGHPDAAYIPDMVDVNTPEGVEQLRIDHPEIYSEYERFWNNKGVLNEGDSVLFASQQKPKLYQTRTAYNHELLKIFKSEGNVKEKNDNGGLRIQSFSDFEIVHLIDMMQVIMDMSRVGLAGQAYTKVPEFALAFGNTGLKINLSLIAKDVDENSNLVFDDVEGMPFETAMHIRDMYSKNVGTILVVFNDAQLKAALNDSRIDFIIPFHRSQWKKSQYEMLGLPKNTKDYTYQQNERYINPVYYTTRRGTIGKRKATNYMPIKDYWDFNLSGKENAEKYLKLCADNNKRPKFYKLLVDNKDGSYSLQPDGSTDGYWKLLIDFKMYDNDGKGSPQIPVKPEFNMEESNKMLNEYTGGHQRFPADQDTVDRFVSEYKKKHKMDEFVKPKEIKSESVKNPYNVQLSLPDNPTALQIGDAYKNGEITPEQFESEIARLNQGAVEVSGKIKQGEMVEPTNKPYDVPKSVSAKTKVRQYIRTILETGYATPEMEAYLTELVLNGDFSYTPTTNKERIDKAVNNINSQGYQNALHTWEKSLGALGGMTETSNTVATGEALLKLAFEQKNAVDIVNISAELAELGTRLGQEVQAFSLLKRMGGLGQLVYIQRAVNRINADLEKRFRWSKKAAPVVKMNENLAESLAKAQTNGEYDVIYAKIMKDIASQVPSTFLDKWNAWRYMAMLFNPTTHVRNVVGNGIFLPVVRMKDLLALGGEKVFIKKEKRTKVLKVKKAYQDFAEDDFDIIKNALTGTGKYNPKNDIRDEMQIFKIKALETLRKFNFGALEKEDAIFLKRHYRHALGSFLQARNIDLNEMTPQQLTEARSYAFNEALKATYRDASKVANIISSLGRTNPVANVIVEGVLPFKKTPINILKRGIEYSPVGLIKTLGKAVYDLSVKKYSGTEFIDGLASNLVGTVPLLLGVFLASCGVVKGGFDDEEEIDRLMGKQEYSVQIGDKSYTIDWAAPASIPFFMGVAFAEYEPDEDGDWLSNIYNFGIKGFEPILNLSMLSGVNDMITSVSYAEDAETLPQLFGAGIGSYFSQALPTIFGKTANVLDDTRRTRYIDKTSDVFEIVQIALDKIASKTPFASKTRAEYVDAWGETKYTGNFLERFFQQFVSPGYASTVDESAISEEVLRLYRETGEKSVVPSTPAKYFKVKGVRRDLSKEEYYDYATFRGQNSADLVNEAINDPNYKKLTDEQKAKVISDIYDYSNALAKSRLTYSYNEVAAMMGGTDVLTSQKWSRLNTEAKSLLVRDYFLDGTQMTAYKQQRNGSSAVNVFIEKAKD